MIQESGIRTVRGKRGPKNAARVQRPHDQFISLARDVARSPHGPRTQLILAEWFLGKIYDSETYTDDPRYEVERSRPAWDLGTTDLLEIELDQYPHENQQLVVATNLAEMVLGTHNVAVDTPVHVWGLVHPKSPRAVHYFFTSGGTTGTFPVKLTKDGGTQGDSTNPATWTYTVKDSTGTTTLGTTVALRANSSTPRPNGTMTFQTGSNGDGLAAYIGGTLILLDAYEVPGTFNCPTT